MRGSRIFHARHFKRCTASCHGEEGPDDIFILFYLVMSSTYFTEVRTDLPQEAIRPSGSNCFSRGVRTNILPLVIFQAMGGGGGADLLPPLWSSETSLGPSQVRLWAWKGPEGN